MHEEMAVLEQNDTMGFGASSNREEHGWLMLGLHSEAQLKGFPCLLESSFDGQRVFLNVWY